MTAIIQKWGDSQGMRIPKFILDSVNWNENTNLELCTENNKIIITQTKNKFGTCLPNRKYKQQISAAYFVKRKMQNKRCNFMRAYKSA